MNALPESFFVSIFKLFLLFSTRVSVNFCVKRARGAVPVNYVTMGVVLLGFLIGGVWGLFMWMLWGFLIRKFVKLNFFLGCFWGIVYDGTIRRSLSSVVIG